MIMAVLMVLAMIPANPVHVHAEETSAVETAEVVQMGLQGKTGNGATSEKGADNIWTYYDSLADMTYGVKNVSGTSKKLQITITLYKADGTEIYAQKSIFNSNVGDGVSSTTLLTDDLKTELLEKINRHGNGQYVLRVRVYADGNTQTPAADKRYKFNYTNESIFLTVVNAETALNLVNDQPCQITLGVRNKGARKGVWLKGTVTSDNLDAPHSFEVKKDYMNNGYATFNLGADNLTACAEAGTYTITFTAEDQSGNVIAEEEFVLTRTITPAEPSLSGSGTEAEPYEIGTVAELELFRDSVNAGKTIYNAPGVYVVLTDDIDLAGINWIGIGSMTAEHGFMGNFDGNGFKIMNLTINNPALDADGYAYAGLFAVTEGAEGAENVIENLTIENVTINTTGHIVSAAIAYPYYTTVENVTICGDIKITGGDYTAGALAYTRRCVNASNVTVTGNAGSTITGKSVVGGVISDIQMNGGLTAHYSNFSASGLTITGENMVGGISGIIASQDIDVVSVKDVTLSSQDNRVGVVAGSFGGTSTISNLATENVVGATAIIGATYKDSAAIQAKIGDTYYATLTGAVAAAQTGNTIDLLADVTLSEDLVIGNITINTNEKTITGADITTNNTDSKVEIKDGQIVVVDKTYVAKIDDKGYESLAEAIKAAKNGETVTLQSNLAIVGETYTIADGVAITLDLNGNKLTVTDNKTGNYELFYIYGELTVKGDGSIELTATNERNWNASSSIFHNRGGELTIEKGTFEHKGGTAMAFVVDNSGNYYGDATTNIEGGKLTSTYIAIRNRMEQNTHGASGKAILNVSNGTITGTKRSIWAQAASTSDVAPATGEINISGGEIKGLLMTPAGNGSQCMTTITGGTVEAFQGEAGELTVKGGTITGTVTILNAAGETVNARPNADGVYEEVQAVAKIGDEEFETLADAAAAATDGDEIVLLADVTENVILPAGVIFNGNGKTVTGSITAGGDLTFVGYTKVTAFSAGYYNRTITIGAGACLEVTGTGRVTLGYGNTFNITGTITDAKTADKATIVPSLIIPGGISITGGNDATLNVTNAYVKIGNTSSKDNAANGKFILNFTNSIAEFTNQFTLSTPKSAMNPTFELNINNSVFTTASKLCIAAPNTTTVIDNSVVALGSYLRNSGTLTLKNGSSLTGSMIQFGENGGNDGTIIVEGSELTINNTSAGHAMDGNNTGKLIVRDGGSAVINYITETEIQLDATSQLTSKTAGLAITSSVNKGIVKCEEPETGKYVYSVELPSVAKVGNIEYKSIDEAIAAWTNGTTLTLLSDVTLSNVVTLKSTEHHILNLGTYTLTAASGKNAIEITCEGRSSASYALTINADAENPGGINAPGKACIYYKKTASTKDRPIIVINNGVFNGSYSINSSSSNGGTNCPQYWINGGTFNAYMNLTKAMLITKGGYFNCNINCTGDVSAYRQISGGTFKNWQFMTTGPSNGEQKFTVGNSKNVFDNGVYVDDNGYLVVGGSVITEAGDKFEASSANYGGWSSYLKYSSAKDNGLYYTSVEEALADNNKTTGSVTVYVDELDMTGFTTYNGTIVADGLTKITNAPDGLKVVDTEGNKLSIDNEGKLFIAVAKIGDTFYASFEAALAAACADSTITEIVILCDSEVTSFDTSDYYNIAGNLKITANEGNNYTITIKPIGTDTIAVKVQGEGASLTIGKGVTINWLDVVANGFYTQGENMVIEGTLYAKSLKQWTSNGSIVVAETGKVVLGNSDGQFDLNYGSGDVTITGTGDKTAPQFKAGYTTTQGYANGNTLNLKDTYFEGGAWFNLNGKNGTINVDNSILKVSGGDGAGSMTIANSGNVINLTNGAELAVANLTIGAGNTIKLGAGSKITTNKITGTGNLVIDAAGMTAGEVAVITGNLSGFTGTLEVVNNDDLEAKIEDGKLVLVKKPVASVTAADGTVTSYATLQDAFKAATEGCTIEILADVTISEKWDCRYTGSKFTVPVTINGNGHTIKFTGTVNDNNWNTIFRFEEDATVQNLTVDISAATGAQRVISAKKSLTVDGLTIIGSARYGVIFGEGASATDLAATEIVIKNSTLTGTRRAISDNEGGKDVKSVEITGNTLNANVYVSASESIVFNNNKAEGEVDLRSYGADNVLSVEAQGNTLTGAKNYIYAKTIDAQAEFTTKNPPVKVSTKNELDTALAAAKDGDIIVLTADIDYGTTQLAITKTITLDLGGKTLTTGNAYGGISVKNNATIKNGTIVHASNTAAIKVWNATAFEDLVIDVQGKGDANKTIGGIVLQSGSTTRVGSIKNVTIKGAALTNGIETYNCGDAAENVIGSLENVTIDAKGTGMLISAPCGTATNCSISGDVNGIEIFIKGTYSASLELVNSKVEGGVSAHDEFNSNPGVENNGTLSLTVDANTTGASAKDVTLTLARAEKVEGVVKEVKDNAKAKVNDTYHLTLTEALAAWTEGTTLTLLANAEISAPIAITESKTLDGNGNTLTYTGTDRAIDVPNTANGANVTIKNLTVNASKANRGINYNTTGKLIVEKVTVSIGADVDGYAINFPGSADGAKVTITNSKLASRIPVNVWGSDMVIDITNTNITSLDDNANYTYSGIQLNNDTYGNVADGTVVNVTGGSITALDEEGNPSLAVSNWSSTGKVNISDTTIVTGNVKNVIAWLGGVGYTNLQTAFNDIAEKGYNSPLILVRDITLDQIVTIPAGIKATLDLNGHTITGIDNTTGSFGLFTNRGELIVTGDGKITLVATENRGWSAYSSIFSNTVGGKLTIENGTFEHLGGTDMAYAIDNLTNGKGTYAETVINGGTIKSTYRAIRQFLNGVEAQNILTVNGGTIEGTNKSIWMQDPSKNANTGSLTVSEKANLVGDVYLTVTAGSTEWPVKVSIDGNALAAGYTVASTNVPATFVVENVNGTWGVNKGLKGSGTETDPYQISCVAELELFRDSVNAGETKYSAPGVCVALTADIDMAGINWVGIGSATAAHGFMGNFDGKTYKIKNLTINNPALDADGYAYAGLFAVTEGAEGAENVIKNLTIENVTINTTGHIVSAAIAYPYYTTVENVTICGDIKITGGDYTAGALAYTRRCVNASNVTVEGNDGSYITGKITVGGVISDIQMNGGLKANYFNFSVSGVTITGEKSVGGISGIIATQTLNGATVKDVKLVGEKAGIVAGALGGTSTITNVTYENVTGATAIIGTNYDGSAVVEAKIGDTYYSTLENALAAAQAGQTIELLAPIVVNAGETLTLDKDVKIVYTSNVVGEDMFTVRGTLNVAAGTITYINNTTGNNVTVSTISCEPGSVLNVTGGTIENKSVKADGSTSYPYAIDLLTNGNLGDVTVTISGGKVYSDYMAIRQFNNGTACKNTLTVSGGEIYGAKRAIQVHMDNTAAYTTIFGGKIAAGENGYALCLYAQNNENLTVSGGEFLGDVYSATNGFITGGTFEKVYEEYCTEGYIPVKNADGKYIVKVGKFVAQVNDTKYETLEEAIAAAQNGDEVKILAAGTYKVPAGKNITITGAVDGVVFDNIGAHNMGGASVTFNNVTFNYAANSTYKGLQHSGDLVYNNCTFNGQVFLYGQSETFNNCTFNNTGDNYNVWTYGAKAVEFNGCTFNSDGKAVLVYTEDTKHFIDLTVTDTDFIATAAVNGKAAIEIDTSLSTGANVTVDAATTATGFGTGNVSGNSLWNNKKGNNTDANNDITVKVGDETVLAPVTFVAKIGNVGYTSIAAAIKAANAGETVTILAGDYTTDVSVNKAITVQGETDANGNNLVNITGRVSVSSGATVKNLNVHNEKTGDYDCALSVNGANIVIDGVKLTGYNGMRYCYAKGDVTIKNSTIAASYFAYHFDGSAGGKLVIDNCNITGWVSYAGTIEKVTLQKSTFDQGSYAGQRSYTKNLVIDGCTFNAGYKLDIATTGAAITVTDSKMSDGSSIVDLFHAEDAVSSNITVDGDKITYVAKIGNIYYATLEDALANVADWTTIKLVADATLDYNAREAYGRASTTDIIIDGQGFTLTLNQKDSDWSSIGMANADGKLTLKNMTIEKTGYGDTTGAWNTHAINFTCNVEMNNVTVNNAIAVENGATLNNVTINEANGYYGLWISGNGQTVTVNGGEINATNGGRGIKIADEYVDAPASVTLNVTGTKFNTAKKAAVLVTSTAGASITASNVDIENVAADKVNFVWVDEDRAAYNSKVTVSGCTKAQENVEIFVAQIGENYFKTLADAIAAAKSGDTVTLLKDITEDVTVNKDLTIDGAGKTYTGNIAVKGSTVDAIIKNINFVNGTGYAVTTNTIKSITVENCTVKNYGYGFLYANKSTPTVVVKNVSVDSANYGFHWVYGGNATLENVTMTNVAKGLYIQNYAAKTVTLKNCSITSIAIWERDGYTGVQTFAFEGVNTVSNLSTSQYAKYIGATIEGTALYGDLVSMVNKAEDGQTVKLLSNITLDGSATVNETKFGYETLVYVNGKDITIDFNGKVVEVTPNAPNANGGLKGILESVIFIGNSGKLTLKDSGENGGIKVNAGSDLYSLIYNCESTLVIENGVYNVEETITAGSLIYGDAPQTTIIKDGTFILGNASEDATSTKPWIINVEGKNTDFVSVLGGTYNQDLLMNYDTQKDCEVHIPNTLTLKDNGDGTWTIVNANVCVGDVADYNEGFLTLTEAVEFAQAGETITLLADNAESIELAKAIVLNVNGKSYTGTVTLTDLAATLTAPETLKVITNIADHKVVFENGQHKVIAKIYVAQVNDGAKFESLAEAIAVAKSGDTVTLLKDITEDVTVNKDLTIDGNGKTYTGNIAVKGSTVDAIIKNINFVNGTGYAVTTNTIKSITVENCTVKNYGYGFLYANKSTPTVVVKNVSVDSANYGFHWVYGGNATLENVTMTNVAKGLYIQNYAAKTVTLKNCSITSIAIWERDGYTGVQTFAFEGVNTVSNLSTSQYAKYIGATIEGTALYGDLVSMVNKAEDGQTVKLLSNITLDGSATVNETKFGYETLVYVNGKDITIDFNGKVVEVTPNAPNANGGLKGILESVIFIGNSGKLTLKDSGENGGIKVNAGSDLYSLIYNCESTLVIENGVYNVEETITAGSLIYGDAPQTTIIKDGTFILGNASEDATSTKPWIINVEGKNTDFVSVLGGTYNQDLLMNYDTQKDCEVHIPNTLTLKDNGDGTWTIVNANVCVGDVADYNEGFLTLTEAVEFAQAGETITLLADNAESIELAKAIVLNVNGKSYTGTVTLTDVAATLTAPKNLDVVSGVETHYAIYENGAYALTLCPAQNENTGKYYASIYEALAAAKSGETVKLLVDGETETLMMVGAGVKLNLNGHTVAAGNVFSFGDIIDNDGTTDGKGGIIISNDRTKAFVQLQKDNDYLPLYDAADGCYRFYSYSVALGKYAATSNTIKFKFNLRLSDKHAYELLADAANSGIEITARLQVTGLEQEIAYKLTNEVVKKYADAALAQIAAGKNAPSKVSTVMELNVSGLGSLASGTTITFIAEVDSETGVTYEHNVNNPERNIYTTP